MGVALPRAGDRQVFRVRQRVGGREQRNNLLTRRYLHIILIAGPGADRYANGQIVRHVTACRHLLHYPTKRRQNLACDNPADLALQKPGRERDDIVRGQILHVLLPGIGFDEASAVMIVFARIGADRLAPVEAFFLTDAKPQLGGGVDRTRAVVNDPSASLSLQARASLSMSNVS